MKLIVKKEKLKQAVERLKDMIETEYKGLENFPVELKEICDNVKSIDSKVINNALGLLEDLQERVNKHRFKDKWLDSSLSYPNEDSDVNSVIVALYGTHLNMSRLLVTSNGYVGIGSTSPSTFLEIQSGMTKVAIDLDERLKQQIDLTQKAIAFKDKSEVVRSKIHRRIDNLLERLIILTTISNNINGKSEYELTLQESIFFRL